MLYEQQNKAIYSKTRLIPIGISRIIKGVRYPYFGGQTPTKSKSNNCATDTMKYRVRVSDNVSTETVNHFPVGHECQWERLSGHAAIEWWISIVVYSCSINRPPTVSIESVRLVNQIRGMKAGVQKKSSFAPLEISAVTVDTFRKAERNVWRAEFGRQPTYYRSVFHRNSTFSALYEY